MSGVSVLLRERRRQNARPIGHRTRAEYADAMRAAALCNLRLPGMDQDGIDNANELLEMVGDLFDLPRAGWYPKRPARR